MRELFGTTRELAADLLTRRSPDGRDDCVDRFRTATASAVRHGFLLEADRPEIEALGAGGMAAVNRARPSLAAGLESHQCRGRVQVHRRVERHHPASFAHAAGAPRRRFLCHTPQVEEILSLARDYPRRTVRQGEVLVVDGAPVDALYVLVEGALHVEKQGVPITTVREPGACVGEMSLLLGVPATADVVASEPSTVAVIEDAPAMLATDPRLPRALAELLAARLHAMTTYLADLKRQYADHAGGLGMVDVVLDRLMRAPGNRTRLGSVRDPEPED